MAATYDRFTLTGGLDTSTPYLSRVPGTLLQCLNYEVDTDGGYRKMLGFERFDGHPAPSSASVTQMSFASDVSAHGIGDTLEGNTSGATAYVGLSIDTNLLWVDIISGEFQDGETVTFNDASTAVLSYMTPETLDSTQAVSSYHGTHLLRSTPASGPAPAVGNVLVGLTSTAVATVVAVISDGQYWIYVTPVSGEFTLGETVRVVSTGSNSTLVYNEAIEDLINNPLNPAGLGFYFSERRRLLIGQVPGEGPVRGVWELDSVVYAIRDAVGGATAAMFSATAAGWVATPLGTTLNLKDRPSSITDLDLIYGDTITGATSGATAVVGWVGYKAQDHDTGYVSFLSSVGTFVNGENITVVLAGIPTVVGTVDGAPVANILPPGGFYRFFNHNFTADVDRLSMYGVNGVGKGFAFDGTNFVFIETGLSDALNKPFEVKVHYDHLFFAFNGGSLQHSVVGNPLDWSGGLGALEVGLGANITNLILTPQAMIVATDKDIQFLTGTGIDDWAKNIVTEHTGVAKFTGAYQSQSYLVGPAGLFSIDRVDAYGSFSDAVVSDKIREVMRQTYKKVTMAIADKTKGQYRIHYSDGTNTLFSFLTGAIIGISRFEYGDKVVRNCVNPSGRIFFTSDDGYVYEAEKGFNADGESQQYYFRTSFSFQNDPDSRKRYKRLTMSVRESDFVQATVGFTFSKGNRVTPSSFISGVVFGKGGRWDLDNWNEIFWDGADVPEIHSDMDGVGTDVSVMVYCDSRALPTHVFEDISMEYSQRRKSR